MEKQVQKACKVINEDEKFNGKFNVLAFSQGGLIGRAITQQPCKKGQSVKRYISIGTPQAGVSKIPKTNIKIPNWFDFIGPSSYFRDLKTYPGNPPNFLAKL